jgi:hypothetical protein
MSSSDWVAVAGVLISCLAFGVAYLAYRLQARTAQSDSEKELADQIDAIHAHIAELDRMPPPGGSMAAITQNASVNAALKALLLRADALITFARLTPDWYQNLVLGATAVQIGELVTAAPYTERAVALARGTAAAGWEAGPGATARVLSLRIQAWVYFSRGLPGDLDAARRDFDEARQLVRDMYDEQGPSLTSAELIELDVRQADFELDLGHDEAGTELMGRACATWLGLRAPGARRVAGHLISSFAQGRGPARQLLTGDFVREWEAFLAEQNGAVPVSLSWTFPSTEKKWGGLPGLSELRPINVAGPAAGGDTA